jgi:hypothetical protein
MSSKVWSGAMLTQLSPSRNADRMTGPVFGSPTATARRARSIS